MSTARPLFALALLTLAPLVGCASRAEVDRLSDANRTLVEDNTRLQHERDEARNAADMLRGGAAGKEGAVAELQRQLRDAQGQRDQALNDLRAFQGRLAELQIGQVDPETDERLEALTAQFPNLIAYDRNSGMLRFASDLTFDSGSASVKSNAKQALDALGKILTSGAASQYDVVVEGHTDSQRLSAPRVTQYHTNRLLSCYRAAAVIDELKSFGVSPQKMMAAGWGEFRPSVTNSANGNTPQNRRVEIFLVKSRMTAAAATEASTPTPAPTRSSEPEIMK